ncbi:hypothetical protein [Maricaulis parjimensis]|uniref:hypothetical protein n=1 Tax=Maricaulis parjimensis TaxID=144023 RepID=UPI001939C195|nr:hypothetical protein [Maricaulis parjimensis]
MIGGPGLALAGVPAWPGWAFPGARLDLDFENRRFWNGQSQEALQDLPEWSGAEPLLASPGLVCDGGEAWPLGPVLTLGQSGVDFALRIDVSEDGSAQETGYLAILHDGSLDNRLAVLTTRSNLTCRLTLDGAEHFTRHVPLPSGQRYAASMGVRGGVAWLGLEGQTPLSDLVPGVGTLHTLDIGGFNASLPLMGQVHRLTLWMGKAVPPGATALN